MMKIDKFLDFMKNNNRIEAGSKVFEMFHKLSQEALKITVELNNKYHTPDEIIGIFSTTAWEAKL